MFFAAAVLIVVAILHWYLWLRLVRAVTTSARARRAGRWVFAGLGLLLAVTAVGNRALPRRYEPILERVVAWPGYVWLALCAYLALALLALELPVLLAARLPARVDEHRRLLIARGTAITAGLAAAAVTGTGMATALGPPRTRRVQVPLARLPRRLDGLRVALVSDIHLGPLLGRAHTERVVRAVNALDADVVAVVGDLVDGTVETLGKAAEPLRDLRNAYFVTGNHEYFSGHEAWIEEVGELGLRVLRNERVELDELYLAGVNDATGGTVGDPPDYDRALGGRDPARPTVLLAHQPVQALEAARRGVGLQLSGHTHGGQLWPFGLFVRASQPIVGGLGEVGGMPVYVTNGAGFWGPPVRVGAPPDVTLVELRSP
ncbi:metallophosphoesterase [Dactylosporangium sucinum]|uniref:Metallophosphatase n=1 Tax=Dactylosporangium sucinum TaxID=1424081 RepID=A0A917UAV3_9ACTN|nr:metallophosphoesterase [Dactylosporangium sucinum]GGM73425.1 metallophosphatase [Dactylosporangium sucinum]